MLSAIFCSGLAVAVLLIGFYAEHGLFSRNIDTAKVLASERRKQYRSR
jgi:hypothetical protein